MRFTSRRDYQTIIRINKELVNNVVDTTVIIYKINTQLTKTNSYNEATKKTWYIGVECPALIRRESPTSTEELQTVNVEQKLSIAFLRQELQEKNVYPEMGDIIFYDGQSYEIDVIGESQMWAGRPEYRHSIVAEVHLTRSTTLQLDPPIR